MNEKEKTKEQSIDELMKLQRQIAELEKSEISSQQIEKASTDNEEKYRILIELAADGIFIETVEGRILECNTAGAKIYGYTKEEMIGLTIADLVPEEFSKKLPKVITKKEDTHGIFVSRISKKKDGTIFPTEIATKIVHIGGKPRLIAYVRDITKRKEAEKKLRKARKIFASLFNSSPIAALYHDQDGHILNINPYFTKTFGYTLKEISGRNIAEGVIYPENKFVEGERLTKKGLTFKGVSEYETIRKKKDGTLIPVVISASSVIIDGQPKGTIALYRDITECKQNEQLQQVLYNISKSANSAISLDQLYPLIHQELGSIIDTTNFYIALVDEKEDKIFFPYHVDEKDDNFPIINFSTAKTLTAYVIKTGKPLLNDNNQYKEMIAQGVLSPWGSTTPQSIWLGVPLKIEDKTIGVIAVQSYTNPHLYSEKDIELLEFVSSQVATAIERKRTEEALRESHQEFASLFMNSPEALIYINEKDAILNINPRFTKLFGYTLEEIKGKNINEGFLHPPDKKKEGKNLHKMASSKGYFHYETISKKKDGTLFPVSISGSSIKIDGQRKGIISTYIDITERKRLEKKLEKLAHFDVLTGCYARGYGLSLFERQIKSAQRHKTSILLLYVDLNGLKYINDTFGHKEGDKVLKEVAKFFKSILREVDIICRMGGDEFLLIFPDSSLNDVPLIKERITNKLKELNKNLNNPYKISFSIGLSCYNPSNPLPIEELIRIADEDMYKEKKIKNEGGQSNEKD
jgi:diguanylate cyclase (GGDEF)-like protein/PAS domain S-box-containing protein